MIRESKIKELTNNKVVALIENELTPLGFKYQKSKRYFSRQDVKGFSHIIYVSTPYSPLIYDDNNEQLFLVFNIVGRLASPNYTKWYFDNFGQNIFELYQTESLTSQIELSFYDFDSESFYEPTASQQFKRNVTLSLIGGSNRHNDVISLNDLLKINIPNLVLKLSEYSDFLKIYNSFEYPYHNINLLVFGGYADLATEEYKKHYDILVSEIDKRQKNEEPEVNRLIELLDFLIKNVQQVSNLTFENPFKSSIQIQNSKNEEFKFSEKTCFIEKLRLNISQFDIQTISINTIGEIMLFTGNQKFIKLNSIGKTVFEYEIETKKGFNKLSYIWTFGVIDGSNDFFINNFIITTKNEVIELDLPIQKQKKGSLQNSAIADFVYWEKNEQYLIIYEDNFLIYNKEGKLENNINIGEKYGSKIIIEKEWIIVQKERKENVILNFDGQFINKYEFGNGNREFEFSRNYDFLICFGYSTKSQFYNLNNGNKGTLWAHPTFVKDYKEIMYNDTEHNFGMEIAKFAPDNRYIVGGAYHGKYVAWTLPKLERIELIPQDEMIERLEPQKISWWSQEESGIRITKAEKVTLENQAFLKNRGNGMSKILFFENGDIFITQIGMYVLSWDRKFSNLYYKQLHGKLDFHSNRYLTQIDKNEFVIYEQKL